MKFFQDTRIWYLDVSLYTRDRASYSTVEELITTGLACDGTKTQWLYPPGMTDDRYTRQAPRPASWFDWGQSPAAVFGNEIGGRGAP